MFQIQPSSGEPIYLQLIRRIKHGIATGTLARGERLPTVRELAATLLINPNTAARAYRELERDGVVETVRGRGTFVSAEAPPMGRVERRRRLKPVLEQTVAEARALGFEDEELLEELGRLLRANPANQEVET
ncbi:MAG: GntR family transcriptional regulator [Gemmatimonadales bacterium]